MLTEWFLVLHFAVKNYERAYNFYKSFTSGWIHVQLYSNMDKLSIRGKQLANIQTFEQIDKQTTGGLRNYSKSIL